MKKKLGQSPLILGPSSWGAGMMRAPVQLVCPPGTQLTPQGGCIQPQATRVGVPVVARVLAGRRK